MVIPSIWVAWLHTEECAHGQRNMSWAQKPGNLWKTMYCNNSGTTGWTGSNCGTDTDLSSGQLLVQKSEEVSQIKANVEDQMTSLKSKMDQIVQAQEVRSWYNGSCFFFNSLSPVFTCDFQCGLNAISPAVRNVPYCPPPPPYPTQILFGKASHGFENYHMLVQGDTPPPPPPIQFMLT